MSVHEEEMASDASEFWERRRDLRPSSDAGDGEGAWRLVLLVDITDPLTESAGGQVIDRLGQFDCFGGSDASALHLTVKLFDIPVAPSTTDVAGSGPAVQHVDAVVSDVVSDRNPFEAAFTRLNLFPDVVYSEVADAGLLGEMNRALCDHAGVATLDRDGDGFIPHLTLGHFAGDSDYDELVDFLEANREVRLPTLTVTELALVAYEVGGHPPAYDRLETYEL